MAFFLLIVGSDNWKLAYYLFPGVVAVVVSVILLFLIKGKPEDEGFFPIENKEREEKRYPEYSSWDLLTKYVLTNKGVWYISLVDTFVYMIRFGVITWLPIFLQETKGVTSKQMMVAFLVFEWAAIPSTLFAGVLSDRLFKGKRMPLAIISLILISFCLVGYWTSTSVEWVTIFAATAGCLIYVPQFLASVHTMDVVSSVAIGSAVGLRGFMSYVVGATLGTSLLGKAVDSWGWNAGLILLLIAIILCTFFCTLSHFYILNKKRKA